MNEKAKIIVLALLVLWSGPARAHCTVSDRLSSPRINCLAQDGTGRVWIGTERGLNCYNGYEYRQYLCSPEDENTIPDNVIWSIFVDSSDRIWVGTNNGVALYDGQDGFVRLESDAKMNIAMQVFESAGGRILVNFPMDIHEIDVPTLSLRRPEAAPALRFQVEKECMVRGDTLLVCCSDSIRVFDARSFAQTGSIASPPGMEKVRMLRGGRALLSAGDILYCLDIDTGVCRAVDDGGLLAADNISVLGALSSGKAIIATLEGKFCIYDPSDNSLMPFVAAHGLSDEHCSVSALFEDNSGNCWIGTNDKGFHIIPRLGNQFNADFRLANIAGGKSIISLCAGADDILWMMEQSSHDLIRYNTADGSSCCIKSLEIPRKNDLWSRVYVGASGHVFLSYQLMNRIFETEWNGSGLDIVNEFEVSTRQFATDSLGRVWSGSNDVFVHCLDGGQPHSAQLFPKRITLITAILPLEDRLVVGAYKEPLHTVDVNTGEVGLFEISGEDYGTCIPNGAFYPTVMRRDSSGDIWIGTSGNGLLHYDSSESRLLPVPGAPCSDIASIEIDGADNIWVSTYDGLGMYSPHSGAFRNYSSNDGTGGDCFNIGCSCTLKDGRILFGGSHGITEVNPGAVQEMENVPFSFDDIMVGNRRLSGLAGRSSITLRHDQGYFRVSFSAISFNGQRRPHYWYRLEGYETIWSSIRYERTAVYSNVPPGRYTLKVRFSFSPEWSEDLEEHSLEIIVMRPWWKSWWMCSVYALVALLAIGMTIRTRRRVVRNRNEARKAIEEREMEKRQSEMNMKFFSNISHEFRTPLTMIYGPLEQLSGSPSLGKDDRVLLDTVRRSTSRMLTLVNQLLDVGKMESDTLKLKVRRTDVCSVLDSVTEPFVYSAGAKGLTFKVRGNESPLYAHIDEDKFQKIVSNLLSNAFKFTPEGGSIELLLDKRGGFTVLTVSDSGPGIPEDRLEQIFERYYQLDSSRDGSTTVDGSGIGLFYSRSMASIHHGTLVAGNRTDGGGAVFTLSLPSEAEAYSPYEILPAAQVKDPSETVPEQMEAADEKASAEEPGVSLIVVDDDWNLLKYLETLLAPSYDVTLCSSVDDAIKRAMEMPPDLLLSDVSMPGRSGYDLCREVKSSIQLCHIPVVLLTAKGSVENQVEGLDSGADAYVTKPFDPNYLKALIHSQIENRNRIRKMLSLVSNPQDLSLGDMDAKDGDFLKTLFALLDRELPNEDFDISTLAETMKMSRTKLYYKIKGLTGKTPSEFFMQYKLNIAAKLLREGQLNVSEVAFRTGFSTLPHFSKAFKKQFGVSPSHY